MSSDTALHSVSDVCDGDTDRELQVETLLSLMTLDEKIDLIHGNTKFSTLGVPRLGIPERWLTDGPHGR